MRSKSDRHRARTLYRQGKFDEAKAAYLRLAERDPANAATLQQLGTIALWENRREQAQHLFEEASRHRGWLGRRWPFSAELNYRLGLTHYRQDRFATAASYFRAAAGPLAIGPFQELHGLAAQTALFGTETPYEIEGPARTRIPFLATDPLPVIELRVNGVGPLTFFIDTGGAELILDTTVARRVGALLCGSIRGDYAGQKTVLTGLGSVDSATLGDIVMRHVPIQVLDIAAMSKLFSTQIHGILGACVLQHFLSTIDYVTGALLLRRDTAAVEMGLDARAVTPFWLLEKHCMLTWGTLNHLPPMLFFVDTGLAAAGFTASEAVLRAAGISVDWSRASTGPGGAGEVRAVEFQADRVALGLGPDAVVETGVRGIAIEGGVSILNGTLGVQVGGVISHQFFRKRSLTLDFKAMRLVLQ
jgi:Aspartyl protease